MSLDTGRVTALLGLTLLVALGAALGTFLVFRQVQTTCVGKQTVVVEKVMVTPTLEPTATPSAILKIPLKSTTK